MSLNIKNERTVALVRELAGRTGESQTSAVERAVVERLERLAAESSTASDELDARRDATTRLLLEPRGSVTDAERAAVRHAAAPLYDTAGLPR